MLLRGRPTALLRSHARAFSSSSSLDQQTPVTIGIRREDPDRLWERRCPLTPEAVHDLVSREGVRVLVQPCDRRVFSSQDFLNAGAELHPTLAPAQVTLGIKETPLSELLTSPAPAVHSPTSSVARTHLMFSHTIKAQPYNMPLLARFLRSPESGALGAESDGLLPRLIDYELIAGEDGKRTVAFGWFAGVAGALESLSALAHAHLELGVASPFLHTPRPHTHPSILSIESALHSIGKTITQDGTPKSLGPLVIGVTGKGLVAAGVLSILEHLPVQYVTVEELSNLVQDPDTNLGKVYICHAPPESYLSRVDGRPYERGDYYANPTAYKSDFCTKVAPFLSLFLNCAGWAPSFPRIMSNEQLAVALEFSRAVGKGRMASVGDISCDIEGGLEFLTHASTLSTPFYTTRPASLPAHLPGVQMMAVDILPTSLPLDASTHFSNVLRPYLKTLIREYRHQSPVDESEAKLRAALQRATVAKDGTLMEAHQWLGTSVDAWRKAAPQVAAFDETAGDIGGAGAAVTEDIFTISGTAPSQARPASKKRVLLLGSGMVAGPTVDELCKREDIELVVASNSIHEAEALTNRHPNAKSMRIDVTDIVEVDGLVAQADLVISLLPVPFHPAIAEVCIARQKNMVTASYISPKMKELHQRAQSADVLLLNEIGLDPGIDHCSAVALLSDLRERGLEVVSFISFCGGLPAPEHGDIPLGYKFSWSPKGVLQATLNGARFKLQEKRYEIPEESLLVSRFPEVPISNILNFEGIANRDSFPYAETYGLKADTVRTLLRGTLRYPGYCDMVQSFKELGLLSSATLSSPLPDWTALISRSLSAKLNVPIGDNDLGSTTAAIRDVISTHQHDRLVEALQWLSLLRRELADESALPPLPSMPTAPIDLLTSLLAHKLRYTPGERDMVVLAHEVIARPRDAPAGTQEEIHTSQLVTYGTPSASAMSRTVGLPVAFAALQILDGKVTAKGVHGPDVEASLYRGVLEGLTRVGLGMQERVVKGMSLESKLAAGMSGRG